MATYKMNKYQIGGKYRRPFTGFEGLTYEYEAPVHSLQGRAQIPEMETIYNNGKFLSSKETWYDPEIYNNTGKLQIEDQGYSVGDGAETEWEPTEQQKRTFNSLKRHALVNQYFKEQENPKFQQGGQLNMNEQELQQAFIQFLAQKTGAKTQQELEAAIQQLGEEGLKQAYAEFMQLIQQQQVQAAKFGAKINYIKKLRGQCPDGYELQYYKSGGQLCKKCMKKQVIQEGGNVPQDPIDQFKCGRKMKKKKCETGGTVDIDKCGAKMKKKKCENGGFIPFDKCGKKMKKKQEGGGLETSKPTKTNKTPFVVYNGKGKKKVTYVKDEATRDSLYANRYNDQEVQVFKPGSYKNGKWTPDRSKSPYKRK